MIIKLKGINRKNYYFFQFNPSNICKLNCLMVVYWQRSAALELLQTTF